MSNKGYNLAGPTCWWRVRAEAHYANRDAEVAELYQRLAQAEARYTASQDALREVMGELSEVVEALGGGPDEAALDVARRVALLLADAPYALADDELAGVDLAEWMRTVYAPWYEQARRWEDALPGHKLSDLNALAAPEEPANGG